MASKVNGNAPESFGNFDLVKRLKLDFTDVQVSKWKSRETGLSIVHLDYEAPIVNGYFVIATEIFDDTGCPHTLEHLVFMGSEKYPYKGIIDHLANRGYSNGTNAWTDTDHTAYTVSTAGEQGFLQILPVYVDHILYPTLTKAGFVTEVHHIDGKGEDSGVVYSEMQGRENTSQDLMALQLQRLLNPPGSAYSSETGGLMKALRDLTVEQIRDYHHKYYVPHNLSLIVSGKLASGTQSLLKVVQEKVEPSIIEHGQKHGFRPAEWKRPFVETPSANRGPIKETKQMTVEFPEKDESVGEVYMGFMGPPPNAFLERKALDILATYLTSSAVAPLNKEYVEVESPLCTYIYLGEDSRATLCDLPVYIGSVPTEHLDSFPEKLKASLIRIADEGIDMDRMGMVINRDERQLRSKLESAKGETFSGNVIGDFLYGAEDGSDLKASMDDIVYYAELRTWSSKQWTDLLRQYYITPARAIVRGKPSSAMVDKLKEDEQARIAAQKERLGPEGLAKATQELEEAKKEHDTPIPQEILTSFPVPDIKTISFIAVQSLQEVGSGKGRKRTVEQTGNAELTRHVASDGAELPFFVQYDHVQSDFVTVNAYFSTAKLPNRLRPHMQTYLSAFFSLPITRSNGEKLSHEEVVTKLDNDTVSYEAAYGVSSAFSENVRVSIKVEVGMYEAAIAWLKDLIYGSVFDKERLQITIAKIQQSLPEMKRDGDTVLGSVSAELLFDETSMSRMTMALPQTEFIPKLAEQLQQSPEEVVKDFEEIRRHLTDSSCVRFSVAGDVLSIKQPREPWAKYFQPLLQPSDLLPVTLSKDTLSTVGKNPVKKAVVVSLPTIESSYTSHVTKGIQGFTHDERPAFVVAAEVLNATESYLWRYIRGSGLAYGATVYIDLEGGFLSFSLYRTSQYMKAYEQAKSVIQGLVDGSIPLEETTLDAAKSSIVFGVARGVSTPGRAAVASFLNQAFRGVPQNYNIDLLERYRSVTKADVLAVLRKYFLALFDPSSSVAVVVTAPGKIAETTEGLTKLGFEVEQRSLEVDADADGSESGSEGSDSDMSGSESGSDR
ncbi:Metalloenzyme, LuxS/M16 peptidase-like protein [Rhodofomes roseus]|uniref:Metalloenzyme, LuxS/M16 peptidase-like protein n=1 Tax=Rhodofomes roseus TaxID=34475 RepID=A0ABQ8KI07_9APHY|nr:Metalloenzyme, LuxS/M16 peptidase-like protein [Rhodofomes roseus]KAH9837131.1 Metalloenzyme, LuxS/M16 peptidase-like protein [Rhodofomes roseus]